MTARGRTRRILQSGRAGRRSKTDDCIGIDRARIYQSHRIRLKGNLFELKVNCCALLTGNSSTRRWLCTIAARYGGVCAGTVK